MKSKLSIEDVIKREGKFVSTTVGVSMYPMLRDKKDTIVVSPKCGRLKKYDIPLYRRGNQYVLHRVIKVLPESGYNIRGDNCYLTEENISEENIIGVLTEFWRNGKKVDMTCFSYKLYSRLWVHLHPIIFFFKRISYYAVKLTGKISKIIRRRFL